MQLIRCFYQTSISTCFGHHYAHHQENKTVYYCIWCSAPVVLAVVVWSRVVRLSKFYLNMFRASLCPSSGEEDRVYCIWCSALVVLAVIVWNRIVSCVHCVHVTFRLRHTVHTAYDPAPHNHSQHNQCRTPYAVIHGLVLLMMGIMMPETCWDRSLIRGIGLVASYWFISLHHTFHDARSQEPKTHFVFNKGFRKSYRLWDNVGKYFIAGQATDDSMTHAHCVLGTLGYKHTLRVCNTYCFSTVTVVQLSCLNITLYIHCLSCFWRQYVQTNLTFKWPYRLFFPSHQADIKYLPIKRRSL